MNNLSDKASLQQFLEFLLCGLRPLRGELAKPLAYKPGLWINPNGVFDDATVDSIKVL